MRIDHYFCLCRYSANTASDTEGRDHGLAINELWFSSLVILGPDSWHWPWTLSRSGIQVAD